MTEEQFDSTGLADKPILTSGSAGPAALVLCEQLAELEYETSVSRGENPYGIVDESVMSAVQQFRRVEKVAEDAAAFGSDEAARTHIGPHTWAALRDAIARAKAPEPAKEPPKKAPARKSRTGGKKK